jgi:hypothetical protein
MAKPLIQATLHELDGVWSITLSGGGIEDSTRTYASEDEARDALSRTLEAARKLEREGVVGSIEIQRTPREAS